METPIYDATRKSFEHIEKKIDDINAQIDKKINDALKSGREYTQKEIEQLKNFFTQQINSLKEMFLQEQENQNKKLAGIQEKIETIKSLLSALSSPPSIDNIVSWAKSAAQLYTMQYEQVVERATDITKTVTYIGVEIPTLTAKITRLPDIVDKLNSIPIK